MTDHTTPADREPMHAPEDHESMPSVGVIRLADGSALTEYRARCSCGWSDVYPFTEEADAEESFDAHLAAATAAPAPEHMPAIVFDGEAAEAWAGVFDAHRFNATFTRTDGTTLTARIDGSTVRESDGFYAVRLLPVDASWEPIPDAEPIVLASDEFTHVTFH